MSDEKCQFYTERKRFRVHTNMVRELPINDCEWLEYAVEDILDYCVTIVHRHFGRQRE